MFGKGLRLIRRYRAAGRDGDVRHYRAGSTGTTLGGMSMQHLPAPGRIRPGPWTQGLLTVLIAVAAVYLVTTHWLHILDALPYLWVVLMLSMHLFMHGGHGGHGGHGSSTHQGHGGQEAPGGGGGHVH